jgi:hypothetical protein
LIYPFALAAILFYNWWLALALFALRLIILGIVWFKSMKKLNEADLFPYFIFLDIWISIYFILFAPALWRRPAKEWK